MEASYQEIEGIFIEGDLHDGWLKLLNNPYRYKLSDSVKIEFENQILGSNTTPSPLIVSKKPLEILPGNTIRLVIDPGSLEVSLIQIIRTVVQGIAKSELNDQGIQIEGFGLLKLMEGIRVNRAGKEPNLSDVKIGDFVQAVYLPKEKKAAYLWATDQSVWGKVIYVSSKERLIYFVDQFQRVYRKKLQSDAIISRWGMHVELAAISPGDWGWFSFGTEGMLEAIKIWETSGQEYRTISQISHDYAEIETKEGEKYKTFNLTAVNKTGLPVPVSEILPGDQVELIPLDLSMELGIKGNILASISASSNPVEEKQNSINLTHSTILMGERIFILGRTNASVVYIYPNSGNEWYEVNVKEDGRFVWWSDKRAQDTGYQLVAVNANKKMYGNYIEVPAGLNVTFEDIRGHKTESIIRNYAQKGIITGFPDNTYKPEKPISLQELALIISKALGWTVCSIQGEREASQLGVAPWAITAYGSMFDRKLHEIFNQNPTWLVSRENIVVLAEKFLQAEKIPKENWPNWKKEFFSQGSFDEPIKRAEAIILIDATLQKLDYFRNLDK